MQVIIIKAILIKGLILKVKGYKAEVIAFVSFIASDFNIFLNSCYLN